MAANHHPPDALPRLLDLLATHRLIDFSAYNPAMLRRRIQLRLAACDQADIAAYLLYLGDHPAEIDRLCDTLTITVSHFFRNTLTFALLRERIIPELLVASRHGGVRIWCAGCAQGEEAYSIAILLHDCCQREARPPAVMIIATDIDRQALAWGARGWYRPEALHETRKGDLDRYFVPDGEGYRVTDEVRSMVKFIWHDLASDTAPREGVFSDYQLILCRNVLIYFTRERGGLAQQQMAARLSPGGWLVLGEAETIASSLAGRLAEVMPGTHIFRKEVVHG